MSRSSSLSSALRRSSTRCTRIGDEIFLQAHVVVGVVPRDLRLDHPELGEVPARLRLLGAEGRAERVDLSQRRGGRLAVELARLREVGVALVEVFGGEQPVRSPIAAVRIGVSTRRNRARRRNRGSPARSRCESRDGALPRGAQPEVAVVEEEIDAVLLRLDRIVDRARADDREVRHAHLVRRPARAARRAPRP